MILFKDADHTMLLFEEHDGRRDYTGYAPGYFRADAKPPSLPEIKK